MSSLADRLAKAANFESKGIKIPQEGTAAYKVFNQDLCLVQFPSGSIATLTHYHYINIFNSLNLEDKSRIKILRAQWLGEAKIFDLTQYQSDADINQIIAEEHAKSIAEMVRRYKANANFKDLILQKKDIDLEKVTFKFYRDWFNKNRGASSFASRIIPALANNTELPELPRSVNAFEFETVLFPLSEINMVKKLIQEQSEPTYPARVLSEKDKQINKLFELAQGKPALANDNDLAAKIEQILADNAELKAKLEKLESTKKQKGE